MQIFTGYTYDFSLYTTSVLIFKDEILNADQEQHVDGLVDCVECIIGGAEEEYGGAEEVLKEFSYLFQNRNKLDEVSVLLRVHTST